MNTIINDVQLHKGIAPRNPTIQNFSRGNFVSQENSSRMAMPPVNEHRFDKEAFLKQTLLDIKTILKLRFLRPAWTRTYQTYLHDFQHLPAEAYTIQKQQEVLEFVQRIWDHSVEV